MSPGRLTGNPYERFHHRSMAKSEPYAQRRRRDPSPADSRLTPSARELLESRHLRIKFIDEQGRLFVDDEQQQPQPVHGLTSSDEHPQACCELCRQPVAKAGYADSPVGGKMVAKAIRVWVFARFSTAPLRWQCGCKLNWRNRGSRGWRISVRVLATLCAPMRWGTAGLPGDCRAF